MRGKNIHLCTCVLILTLLGVVKSGGAEQRATAETQEPLMRVYFVPFEFVTYFPITMNSIGEGSRYTIWFVDPGEGARQGKHPFISKLHRQLQLRPAPSRKIDDYIIRLRVDFGEQTFFADAKGTVLEKVSGRTFLLSKVQRREIEKEIIYFAGVVDVNAGKKLVLFPD